MVYIALIAIVILNTAIEVFITMLCIEAFKRPNGKRPGVGTVIYASGVLALYPFSVASPILFMVWNYGTAIPHETFLFIGILMYAAILATVLGATVHEWFGLRKERLAFAPRQ